VVFIGTSLTAGYGLDPGQAYPRLIQDKIDAAGLEYRAHNAGLSGETSAGAVRRVDWLFRQPIDVLVIETGANDGLRGQDPAQLKVNIQAIIDRAKQQDPPPQILLLGMEAPPNLGAAYTRRFRAVYRELARENGAELVPFLLDGVAGVESMNQADGIHPTPRGQALMAETVWRVLEPMLEGVGSRR
jgi:acyl-CoA thioesterase-1